MWSRTHPKGGRGGGGLGAFKAGSTTLTYLVQGLQFAEILMLNIGVIDTAWPGLGNVLDEHAELRSPITLHPTFLVGCRLMKSQVKASVM